jgi:integrase
MSADGSLPLPLDSGSPAIERPAVVTIADVLVRIEADARLTEKKKAEMRSALNVTCRALGAHPSLTQAEPRLLRPKLAKLTPAMVGVKPRTWANIKSLTLKALKHAGLKSMAGRSREPLSPSWEALRSLLPDKHWQSGLSRFMSYCSAAGIAPEAVTAATFSAFAVEVEGYSFVRDPGGLYRDTCKLWNQAAKTIPGWVRLEVPVPDRRRNFAMALDAFSASFRVDVNTFLARGAEPDVFSDTYCKPVSPLTIRNRKRGILMAATALVRSGTPATELTDLAMLVDFTSAKRALQFLFKRAGGQTNSEIYKIATLLKTIARHHLRQSETTLAPLRQLCTSLKPEKQGFTEKNRRCLRQFSDLKKLAALLKLPERVLGATHRKPKLLRRDAVRVELAIAVAILLNIPLRAANLAGLRLDEHLLLVGERWFLSIPANETKNDVVIEAELPAHLGEQLQTYINRYRPLLVDQPTPWLFPGENGARRPSGGFGQQLSTFIAKEVGVVITPHQFRHLAAKLYLDRYPDGFETVRRLLGHKSIETTMRFYRELESILAGKRYAALLEELMAKAVHIRRPRGNRHDDA